MILDRSQLQIGFGMSKNDFSLENFTYWTISKTILGTRTFCKNSTKRIKDTSLHKKLGRNFGKINPQIITFFYITYSNIFVIRSSKNLIKIGGHKHSFLNQTNENPLAQKVDHYPFLLKLKFSKKTTKFETISHLIWRLISKCQIKWKIISNFCGLFRMSELYLGHI